MEEVIAGRYAVGAELGRGGMARVVAARDLRLHRAVAVKLLPADPPTDPASRQRFVREARAAASFSHPHAVAVFDAGDADGVLYLVMELVDGPSLASVLGGHRQLEIDEAVRIADQVLQALGAAHRAGIVHRDVKPGNVLIASDGAAKLADFGIAKRLDDLAGNVTATGQFIGTPTYLAPEQVAGQPATAATDLYSTGVLLFEMLAGGPPFDAGTPMATALAHRDAPVPDVRARRPDVPTTVAEVVRRAMAKDPVARFASAEQIRAALSDVPVPVPPLPAPLQPTAQMPASHVPAAGPPRSFLARSWWWLTVAGALLAVVVVVAVTRADDPDAGPPAATTTLQPAPSTTALPTTTVAPTTLAPTTTAPPPTAPASLPVPASVDEALILLDDAPERFGTRADELRRDLERIADHEGRDRDVERLEDRLTEWTEDGTLPPDAAAAIAAALATAANEGDGGGGGGEGED